MIILFNTIDNDGAGSDGTCKDGLAGFGCALLVPSLCISVSAAAWFCIQISEVESDICIHLYTQRQIKILNDALLKWYSANTYLQLGYYNSQNSYNDNENHIIKKELNHLK